MKLWKVLGVAGLAGVAATGAIIARDQRQRAQLTPDEVRERLRRRVAEAAAADADADPAGTPPDRAQPGSTDSSARA
jgi:hypothetical protein